MGRNHKTRCDVDGAPHAVRGPEPAIRRYGLGPNVAIVFSNNNGSKHRGGTCSGDSGGSFFVNDTNQIVAVNSFGVPPNCTGNDGAYRIDQPDDIAWLTAVLAGTPASTRIPLDPHRRRSPRAPAIRLSGQGG